MVRLGRDLHTEKRMKRMKIILEIAPDFFPFSEYFIETIFSPVIRGILKLFTLFATKFVT